MYLTLKMYSNKLILGNMEDKKSWPVDGYAKWTNKKWVEKMVNKEKCTLLIQGSQLVLINEGVALESICLMGGAGDVKPMQSNDNLGISIVVGNKTVHKFKIRLATCGKHTKLENCLGVVKAIKKFVPVTAHPSHKEKTPVVDDVVKTLPDIVKELLEQDAKLLEFTLPEKNILEGLQSCLLDPGFPAIVTKIENMLNENQDDEYDDINI